MASYDRREIVPLLGQYFPTMGPASTSDDWHGFLNALTGLDISIDAPNGVAFDAWRRALANGPGLPVWKHTQARLAKIAADGVKANDRAQAATPTPEALADLALAAPAVPAKELLK